MPNDWSSLKNEVDKLDIGKLEATPADLSKLGDVAKDVVLKKNKFDQLVERFNTIETTFNRDFVKNTDYNTKFGEIERKILDHGHDKYIITQDVVKLISENFNVRLKKANVASKISFGEVVKKTDFADQLKNNK